MAVDNKVPTPKNVSEVGGKAATQGSEKALVNTASQTAEGEITEVVGVKADSLVKGETNALVPKEANAAVPFNL